MSETDLHRQVLLLSDEHCKLFRNNVGAGWQGRTFSVAKGRLVSGAARYIQFGLGAGSSDIVGATSVLVTPEMVGKRIAVFTAIELKSKGRSSTTEQRSFIRMVKTIGGLGDVAYSVVEASDVIHRKL